MKKNSINKKINYKNLLYLSIILPIALYLIYQRYGQDFAKNMILKLLKDNNIDVKINGSRPWDITVHNPKFYTEIMWDKSMGMGEGYMHKYWTTQNLEETLTKLMNSSVENTNQSDNIFSKIIILLNNMQSISRSFQVGEVHYDIGNDLYNDMLDPYMQYTCGYWKPGINNLKDAQLAKMDLIAKKLKIKPRMQILDIGCGFGGLMKYLEDKYKVNTIGLTISKEQKKYALERYNINSVIMQDYREYAQNKSNHNRFDRIIVVGMLEHVGYKNYQEFFQIVNKLLKPDGLFLLHTEGRNISTISLDTWINKYMFPNAMLPSIKQIGNGIENLFVMEDWHNFGPSYAKTLNAWNIRSKRFFKTSNNPKYDEVFQRMWEFYLVSCKVGFKLRQIQLWQIVLSPKGIPGGHKRICS